MRAPDIITVDVEEWFHGHNYLSKVPPGQWEAQESRVEQGTTLCLDLLDRHQVKATFFVLGWTADRHPDVVSEIISRGHEIGCHSHTHPVIFEMSREDFRADCLRALEVLARCGADDVVGFRAPSFSITPPVHDYLDVLQEVGFSYDSSIFPVRHPRYGQPGSPRRPFRLGEDPEGLIEIPLSTWRFLGQNVPYSGGGYLRLLPWPAFKTLRGLARRQGVPCITYLHPWELDDFKPSVGLDKATAVRSTGGQDSMPIKLEKILSEGRFVTMGDYAAGLRDQFLDLPRVTLPGRAA
jgi:polysaccharide deacetylase family protein (PEP-CTERM system associated)